MNRSGLKPESLRLIAFISKQPPMMSIVEKIC